MGRAARFAEPVQLERRLRQERCASRSCSVGVASAAGGGAAPALKEGGSLTVLLPASTEGAWPQGLDPGVDANGGSNEALEDAIFGELFEIGPNGSTVPDLATGYKITNSGKTVSIGIRKGVTFSDGTPFNAAAVVTNWKRDFQLNTSNTPAWPLAGFSQSGPYTEVINLTAPYSPIINSMHTRNVNFIASPTALAKMGAAQFTQTPVGAGPFTVVSDTVNTALVLKKNPTYWQASQGLPYLDNLTFKTASSDGTALEDMQAGQAQVYQDMTTPNLVKQFQSQYAVIQENTAAPFDVQFYTLKSPFNNILAREAVYYATDSPTLDKSLFGDVTKPVEGFTGPGGLFYDPTVPGYRTYNLAKAKALVKQLGGLSFSVLASQTASSEALAEGLQTQWQAAGMKVTLEELTTPQRVQDTDSGNWQTEIASDGAFDPATGVGQDYRFLSTSATSGVHDPKLDALLNEASAVSGTAARTKLYNEVAEYESNRAYVVQLFPSFEWNVTDKGIYGPGLTTVIPAAEIEPEAWWQNTGFEK
jgi:peptide/nickel transport system substrate-binding protein